jgi:ABC-type iron transport system FetAB permease component
MTIEIIPLERLLIMLIPMALVIYLMRSWGLNYLKACYAIFRMLLQLMFLGYVLIVVLDRIDG